MRDKNVRNLTELRDLLKELKTADENVAKVTETTEKFVNWANKWCEKYPTDIEFFNGVEITVPPPNDYVPSSRQLNVSANESNTSGNLFFDSNSSEWQDQTNESVQDPSPIVLEPLDISCTPPPPPKKFRLLELANWAYEDTIMCSICKEDSGEMIECEKCQKFCHVTCLGLDGTPDHAWTCEQCFDDRETD